MTSGLPDGEDSLTLRFVGQEEDGSQIHELLAIHVAEVLQGVVGLASDFSKAGAFGEGPGGSSVLVRPAQEGSFIIEVVRAVSDNPEVVTAVGAAVGAPTLSQVLWWATKSARAEVSGFEYLENGNVKVEWQDNTAQEVSATVWEELQKRKRRRKKHLRQIMAPLGDPRVSELEVTAEPEPDPTDSATPTPDKAPFTLGRADYVAVRPEDEITEEQDFFEVEARMAAIDFENPERWRVTTGETSRAATVEDRKFLREVREQGRAISYDEKFRLSVRRDTVVKNGRSRSTWTVLQVRNA